MYHCGKEIVIQVNSDTETWHFPFMHKQTHHPVCRRAKYYVHKILMQTSDELIHSPNIHIFFVY